MIVSQETREFLGAVECPTGKALRLAKTMLLAHNYLRRGYGVVLPGLILTEEEAGRWKSRAASPAPTMRPS